MKHKIENEIVVSLLISPTNQTRNKNQAVTLGNSSETRRGNKKMGAGGGGFGVHSMTVMANQAGVPRRTPARAPLPLPRGGLLLGSRRRVGGYICQDPCILEGAHALSLPMEYEGRHGNHLS